MPVTIDQLDRNFAPVETTADTVWYDIRDLGVEGRGWNDTESYYDRLPARAKGVVRQDVWLLAQAATGMCVRFVTDATAISGRWTVRSTFNALAMDHMPATGVSGLDLYGLVNGRWWHAGTGRPTKMPLNQAGIVANMLPGAGVREFILYLPLYNGVESVQIGLPPGATLAKAPPYQPGREKPIVFYGTSVTQGGCASRPGMLHTSIIGRRLGVPTINLGFSGNGRMEIEVGRFLAELDPCMFVIDCLGNVQEPQITERCEPLVRCLREARPKVPIVLLDNIPYTKIPFDQGYAQRYAASNAAQKAAFERLVAAGVKGLHHVPAGDVYGNDGEATVDGCHATDLGFLRMADALTPVLARILKVRRARKQCAAIDG